MKYEKYVKKVEGKKGPKIFIFTLSTCIWCKKAKAFMNELGLEYSFVDADLVDDDVSEEVDADMEKYNPDMNYPTIVIDDGRKVINGFEKEKLRKILAK